MTISRVLVANRGEIAVRIVRTCRELGLETVVCVSDADRDSRAAQLADRAVCIGPGPAGESYLRHATIVHAALGTDCDAVHPGYGFLSENPALAAATRAERIRFVGPRAEVILLAGDKLRAREAAVDAGLPVVPGRSVESLEAAVEFAADAGYPVLVKAAGGGGGRGIKLARDEAELRRVFGAAAAEAGSAFGDDRLYVERFIRAARHIEVQIAADEHGSVVHLGERECSVQRRYQKVIEEAPAPGLPADVRDALTAAGVAFARAIRYTNLGTVEFVVDAETGEFFFLEMNCRIQVEHPVTEQVTGLDLVAEQLFIADGRPLRFTQDDVKIDGHAVEARLTAEDVQRGFAPSPGRISRFSVPPVAGLRVDTHCEDGTFVPPYYDSLLAKLIGHGADREAAIAVLARALAGLEVEGVATNRSLLADVLAHPDFSAGTVTTTWLEEALA
jgi:acetyl-CoA carboxylase biotin carboxylase subunit